MLDTGVITESSSDWASAPVLVRKKGGTVRYCIDYRCLNSKTKKDLFPLPSISQCMDQLSGNQYFSTLDMASRYWQIEIAEKDLFGLFEHKRMAFGLCNAPATFQRVIQFVLRGLTWDKVLAYIDDVIILGKDFENHLKNLQLTFERFRKHNLKLKPKKSLKRGVAEPRREADDHPRYRQVTSNYHCPRSDDVQLGGTEILVLLGHQKQCPQ